MKFSNFKRKRKPIIALICEGKNQTESKFFNHFNTRENNYNLKIIPSEATDPNSMAKKAKRFIDEMQLDSKLGDKVYCVIDIDLSITRYEKIKQESQKSNKKCQVEFVLSNPCFEIWLLYYYTKNPKVETSSQKVKDQLKKYVPQYFESYDIVKECNLVSKHKEAIINAKLKNKTFDENGSPLEKNPYTEIPYLIEKLFKYNNEN